MSEPSEISSRQKWYAGLLAAKQKTRELPASALPWTVASVIAGRLDGMASAVANGRIPKQQDRERGIGLGVVALRSAYAIPDYCHLLLELSDAFDHWAELPEA